MSAQLLFQDIKFVSVFNSGQALCITFLRTYLILSMDVSCNCKVLNFFKCFDEGCLYNLHFLLWSDSKTLKHALLLVKVDWPTIQRCRQIGPCIGSCIQNNEHYVFERWIDKKNLDLAENSQRLRYCHKVCEPFTSYTHVSQWYCSIQQIIAKRD